jgi:hypothetical protein
MIPLLAITASVLSLGATAWYNLDLFRGVVRPNLSSWAVWTCITLLSSTSYFAASSDALKSLLAFSNSAGTVATFILIIWRGRFSRIARLDLIAGALGIMAAAVWFFGRSAAWGNLVLQLAIAIGCIPTYRSVLADPTHERPGPWLVWSGSFILGGIVVLLRWTGHPLELAYSIVGFGVYGGIGILALRGREGIWQSR